VAAIVSIVSPDCEITIPKSFSPTIGSLYLNSEASSTLTGIPRTFSNKSLPNKPA